MMMESFTVSSISIAFCISPLFPVATVMGSWIIMQEVGAISTFVPAMAITDAADAAIPSILTVTSKGYSISMV